VTEWFYEFGGAARGPVSETDLRGMLGRSELPADTRIWTAAFGQSWRPASQTQLRPVGIVPPALPKESAMGAGAGTSWPGIPVAGFAGQAEPVQTGMAAGRPTALFAWLLAATPVAIALVDIVLLSAGKNPSQPPLSTGIAIWSAIIGFLLAWRDAKAIEAAGLNPGRRALVLFLWLTPIGYFIRRNRLTGLPLTPLWVWLGCVIIFVFIEIGIAAP